MVIAGKGRRALATIWVSAVVTISGSAVFHTSDAAAKFNPPGCKNAGAGAHNPNCNGDSSTHPPVPLPVTTTTVQTIVVTPTTSTPSTAQTGASGPGSPAPIVITPSAPQTITGYSPSATYGAPVTGYSPYHVPKPSIVVTPDPPQTVTGFSPFAVHGPPITGYAPYLVPQPMAQPPKPMTAIPGQTITGYSPYFVPPDPSVAGPAGQGTVTVTGQPGPAITGYSPYYAPNQPVQPSAQSGLSKSGQKSGSHHLMHVQHGDKPVSTGGFVPPKPGDNFVDGYRSFYVDANGGIHACATAGLGKREVRNQVDAAWQAGHAETLHFRSATAAHLPANNRRHSSECLVSVQKIPPQK